MIKIVRVSKETVHLCEEPPWGSQRKIVIYKHYIYFRIYFINSSLRRIQELRRRRSVAWGVRLVAKATCQSSNGTKTKVCCKIPKLTYMATLVKLHQNLVQNGFTQAELDEADNRQVNRDFFVAGVVYGGADDKIGKFAPHKSGFYLFANAKGERVNLTEQQIANLAKEQENGVLTIGKTYTIDGKTVKVENKLVVWSCAYIVGDQVKEGLSRTFLLSKGRFDNENRHIAPKGSVREWADRNIIAGVLEKEWCKALSDLLNNRGLIVTKEDYTMKKKDGGVFTATFMHPHFADTYTAE